MLTSLAFIFIFGFIFGEIADKLKLPKLTGYLIAGIILSPEMLNLLDEKTIIISDDLRKMALVIILSRAGLSLKINEIKAIGRPAFLLSFVPAICEIIAITIFAPIIFDVSYLDGAIIGSVLAAVSPAVIVPSMLKIMQNKYGTNKFIPQLIMAGASIDDVFVIVFFTSLTTIAKGGEFSVMSFLNIPISIILGGILGFIIGIITGKIFNYSGIKATSVTILFLSFSFMLLKIESVLEGIVPISGLITIMVFGMTILNKYPQYAENLSQKLSSLWIGAQIILFVLVGYIVDIKYVKLAGISAIILLFSGLIFRGFGVQLSLIKTNLNPKERLFSTISYMPKATVQAAIGSIPLAMGLSCGKLVVTVAVLAILITAPLGAFAIENTYKKLLTKEE